MRRLEAGGAPDLEALCAEAAVVAGRPGVVTRRARARHLSIGLGVPLVFVAAAGVTMAAASVRDRHEANDELGLLQALAVIDVLERQQRDSDADEQLRLARAHARAVLDGPFTKSRIRGHILAHLTSVESHHLNRAAQAPTPSAEDVTRARDLLMALSTYRGRPIDILRLTTFAEVTAQPGRRNFDDLSFRVGCAALVTEFEHVLTDQGFWRSAPGVFVRPFRPRIAQCLESPPLLSARFSRSGLVLETTIAATLMLFAAGIISAIQTPSRGWPDRIAGTHLVPE